MSNLTDQLCLEAATVNASMILKALYSIRIILGIIGLFSLAFLTIKKGSAWIPHPNANLLYKAHIYFAIHVSFFFTLMYTMQLVRSDPCFYTYDARVACIIRLIPGIGIHFQSFNMFTFAIERAISTLYPKQYEKISKPYIGIFLITVSMTAAFLMDFFSMYFPIKANSYVSVLTSKNAQNQATYGVINYAPLTVELITISVFAFTYRLNIRKTVHLDKNSNELGDRYQVSENVKVIGALFPCFFTHFFFNVFSYGILTILPLFYHFDLVTNLMWVEIVSQAMTYSVVFPAILLWRTRKTRKVDSYNSNAVTDMYFQQLNQLFNA